MEAIINRHKSDFRCDFTIEFDVKNSGIPAGLSEELYQREYQTGEFTNSYGMELYNKIHKVLKSNKWFAEDWSFAGRSNGWYVLLCQGELSCITPVQLDKITKLVKTYYNNYGVRLVKYYTTPITA